ncbi:5'-nucleotidase [Lactarius hengduanensis]|nr:5'-nucleotidase [Lactarius hengduanensis]
MDGLSGGVVACSTGACPEGDHTHEHARRAPFQALLTRPLRPLVWGDVGDFGDFASIVAHMKKIAGCWKKDVDLSLLDFGDLHDGSSLSNGFPPLGFDRAQSNQFFSQLPYDVLAIGNHELYIYANALDMHQNFAPKFPGRVPVGSRFAKFKTRKGRKVTSLGVEDMVKEAWIQSRMPDFFLLVGYVPIARLPAIFTGRASLLQAPSGTTPILILGGHTHRDCLQFDGRSIALLKRVRQGLSLGVDLDHRGSKRNLTVNCRYLDPNHVIYERWNRPALAFRDSSFGTSIGRKITKGLEALAARFDLDFEFGMAPRDYTLSRDPSPSSGSLLSLIADQVLPTALTVDNTRANIPNTIITNSGSLRFDIHAGPFTKNDQLAASPFTNAFVFIAGVPLSVASAARMDRRELAEAAERYARGDVETRYRLSGPRICMRRRDPNAVRQNLTPGYVTKDVGPSHLFTHRS